MKSEVFQFEIKGLFRLIVTGNNEGRFVRYCQRIGKSETSEEALVSFESSRAGTWRVNGEDIVGGGRVAFFKAKPAFYESKYSAHFIVEDKSVTDCRIEHVMASVADEFEYMRERNGMDGTLDFVNAPGRFILDIAFWRGNVRETVRLTWWVCSEKIDVCRDAGLIIKRVEKAKNGFVYSFLTKTKNEGGVSSERNEEDHVWFDLFKSFVDKYQAACDWIVRSPHLKYVNEASYLRADRIRRWTPQQANRFGSLSGDRKETELFRSEQISPITDTIENRFVKHTLQEISKRLGKFREKCAASRGDGDEKGVSQNQIDQIDGWRKNLEKTLAKPFFRGVGRFTGFRQESLALQRKRGYSKIQQTWIALQHSIDVMGKGLDVGNQPMWKLYEFWCFILMRDLLTEHFKFTVKSGSLGPVKSIDDVFADAATDAEVEDDQDIGHEKGGNICRYEFKDESSAPHRLITLTYQQSYYDGQNGENRTNIVEQIPDIVLTIQNLAADGVTVDKGETFTYLFDAKYRIYSYPSKKNPQKDAAPFVTLNDMHRYRDAILYRQQTDKKLSREVIGAYVLYPGRCDKSYSYDTIIQEENIGAIPLLPTKYVYVDGKVLTDANGNQQFEGDDGEAHLRSFLEKVFVRQTGADHLGVGENGNAHVLSVRGTSVVVGEAIDENAVVNVHWDADNAPDIFAYACLKRVCPVDVSAVGERDPNAIRYLRILVAGRKDLLIDAGPLWLSITPKSVADIGDGWGTYLKPGVLYYMYEAKALPHDAPFGENDTL